MATLVGRQQIISDAVEAAAVGHPLQESRSSSFQRWQYAQCIRV